MVWKNRWAAWCLYSRAARGWEKGLMPEAQSRAWCQRLREGLDARNSEQGLMSEAERRAWCQKLRAGLDVRGWEKGLMPETQRRAWVWHSCPTQNQLGIGIVWDVKPLSVIKSFVSLYMCKIFRVKVKNYDINIYARFYIFVFVFCVI